MAKYYRRLCSGLSDYGSYYPADESVHDYVTDLNSDWYASVFLYTEEQKNEAEQIIEVESKGNKINRKRGIGNVTDTQGEIYSTMEEVVSNFLVFDFDDAKLSKSKADTVTLIERLINEHDVAEENIQIYFSGGKGFGVQVDTDTFFTPSELKKTCQYLATDLETFDTKIYNASRILRVPLTKHKTGKYKIPLTFDDLKDNKASGIKEIATTNLKPEVIKDQWKPIAAETADRIKSKIPKSIKQEARYLEGELRDINDIDFSKKPAYLSAAKYVLEMGFIPPGHGQDARMILAASYRKAGKLDNQAYHQLKATSENRVRVYGESARFDKDEMWNNVIRTVYSDSWQGGTYNETHPLLFDIEEMLPAHLKRQDRGQLVQNDSIFSRFKKFAIDIEKNTLLFGIESLDKKLQLLTGTMVGIVGAPGSGKTTLAMNLLKNNSLCGEKSIFYSLDVGESLVALKQIQMKTGLSNEDIYKMVKEDPDRFHRIEAKVNEEFKNVEYAFKFGISPDDIRNDIINYEDKTNEKVRLVVVDYLENVTAPNQKDPMSGAGEVAQLLADVAKELDVLMVVLMQTQKSRQPGEELDNMRAFKGSSVIEQCLSVGIGVSRDGQPLKYQDWDVSMTCNVVKNRYGGLSKVKVGWDGSRSSVHEMTKDEKLIVQDLKDVKEAEAAEEAENNRGNNNGW